VSIEKISCDAIWDEEKPLIWAREVEELEEGMIDGAMNIPLGQLIGKARHGDLDDLKRKKIVTYCSGGYREYCSR
jgi:rhodanese-related sulfurtransferase